MKIIKQNYLNKLNDSQIEAIIHPDGPCLIVAGAGSGKTKVLTTRVVHIIKEKKAWPSQILCVTFTNKAAREMQNRISNFLNEKVSSLPWLGTFHSVSAKILRRHAEAPAGGDQLGGPGVRNSADQAPGASLAGGEHQSERQPQRGRAR